MFCSFLLYDVIHQYVIPFRCLPLFLLLLFSIFYMYHEYYSCLRYFSDFQTIHCCGNSEPIKSHMTCFEVSPITTILTNFFIHLRLKFNLYLTPIYLYGVLIANENIFTLKFLTKFIILHVFLYDGVNTLNDYYDRDEHEPIDSLQSSPPVIGHSLFYLS